ncbi:hypothetical protein [Trichloromonas acetexigens]|uniref:Uncharacterized protein n=1 Tax=Trichloromonas acetexigens TaxID=38815 RepID=A0A550J9K9_9BACT|nr:hypothetical protein [Desulfuromonas acetexigens]TRO79802.1 hypothetical protein FL622_12915 [Desulfuromonas acetexigens]
MKLKTVWGIILIVLGVMGVLNGLQQYADIQALDQVVGGFTRSFGQPSQRTYKVAVQNAQVGGILKILVGIGLSVLGTYWVRDEERKQHGQDRDSMDLEISQDHDDWKM